jgi:CHAD domain-containing protein
LSRPPRFEGVRAGSPFSEAGRIVARATYDAAFAPLPAVLRGDDTRSVHDMRVALRRLRSALATFGGCFPRRRLRPVRATIRRMARRLGTVRDADVHLAVLRGALGGATAADRPGIAYAIEYVSAKRRLALAAFAIELSQVDRDEGARALSDG